MNHKFNEFGWCPLCKHWQIDNKPCCEVDMSQAWKSAEKKVAEYLGGERVSRGADFSKSDCDVRHNVFAIEVKERKRVPKFFREILAQADRYNDGSKLSIGVLHELGARHDNDLVIVRLKDFAAYYGR